MVARPPFDDHARDALKRIGDAHGIRVIAVFGYLLHIRDAISRIAEYTTSGQAAFLASPLVQDAVIRNLEIIGEAAKSPSTESKALEPSIPWRSIAGLRDKLIHHYFGVSRPLVWSVVESELPSLQRAVERLLSR